MAAPSGHQRYHQRQQLQRQQLRYKRSRSGSSTSAAAAGAGCGSSQSRQVVASAEGMHAAATSKRTSWRTPATSRYVSPAFSSLVINKPAMLLLRAMLDIPAWMVNQRRRRYTDDAGQYKTQLEQFLVGRYYDCTRVV